MSLLILDNINGQQIDWTHKNMKIFKDVAFSADIETNSKVVDLLVVTLI